MSLVFLFLGDIGTDMLVLDSLFRNRRYCIGIAAVEDYLAGQDTPEREVGSVVCYEHGSLVCVRTLALAQQILTMTSAGATSFFKIPTLVAIGNSDMSELFLQVLGIALVTNNSPRQSPWSTYTSSAPPRAQSP